MLKCRPRYRERPRMWRSGGVEAWKRGGVEAWRRGGVEGALCGVVATRCEVLTQHCSENGLLPEFCFRLNHLSF